MQKTKKIFSALLAVVMLVSVFTFTTSAGAPVPTTGKVSIVYEVVNANGEVVTSVTPGETVTVNVYANAAAASDTLNSATISIFYDSDVFTYVENSLTWVGLADGWVDTSTSSIDIYDETGTYHNAIKAKATEEELANGWDMQAYILAIATGDVDYVVQENADTPMMSIDLLVGDVADGTPANVGCYNAAHYVSATKSYCNIKTPSTGSRIKSGVVEMPTTLSLTVGSAGKTYEDSIVSFSKEQIRMDKADNTEFSIRHIAVIKNSVWESTFGLDEDEQAEGTKNIKSIGFLYSTTADLDKKTATDALEAVENVASLAVGTSLGNGIVAAPVDYVSTGIVDGCYAYTCVVTGVTDKTSTLSTLGYVVWEDDAGKTHYSYFEDVYSNSFETLYDGYVAAH